MARDHSEGSDGHSVPGIRNNVTDLQLKLKKRIQLRFKSGPGSLLIGRATLVFGRVLDSRTTTSQTCRAVPRRERISGSSNFESLN